MADVNGRLIRRNSVGFNALFMRGYDAVTPVYPDWSMEMPSTASREIYMLDGGLPQMREWIAERERQTLKLFEMELRNRHYELTISVNADTLEDEQTGLLSQRFQSIGVSARLQPDELLAEKLLAGFVSQGYDEVPFFSAAHPLRGGANCSNLVDAALDADSFNEAVLKLRLVKDWYGKPANFGAMGGQLTLMVGPTNEAAARNIVERSLIGGGDTNPNFNRAKVQVFDYLASSPAWFLGYKGAPLRPFIFQNRKKARVVARNQPGDEEMWNQNNVEYGVDGRWALGYGIWQGIVGSEGED